MLKLFILTLTLFSTIPTFAMRAITSRLQQRGYATMTKENFNKLVDNQEPLSPNVFASELATMKKDNEDLKNLWKDLYWKGKLLKQTLEFNEQFEPIRFWNPNNANIRHSIGILMLLYGYPSTVIGAADVASQLYAGAELTKTFFHFYDAWGLGVGFFAVSGLVFLPETRPIAKCLKRFSYTNKVLKINEEKREHVESLLKANGYALHGENSRDALKTKKYGEKERE